MAIHRTRLLRGNGRATPSGFDSHPGAYPAMGIRAAREPSGYQPGFAAEPTNIEDWREFRHDVATRYNGRIHNYEIWNEPNLKQFWTGTTDQLLALTREASMIIHRIDPGATIISPSATSGYGVKWLAGIFGKRRRPICRCDRLSLLCGRFAA